MFLFDAGDTVFSTPFLPPIATKGLYFLRLTNTGSELSKSCESHILARDTCLVSLVKP